MELKAQIDTEQLPQHVAVIMDGNGRWAKLHGKPRVFGHRNGVKSVREVTEAAAELGIQNLTLYAFSTENWKRPKFEVNALMSLLVDTLSEEIKTMQKNNIRLISIGDISHLPGKTEKALKKGIEDTATNDRMNLILALNYSARWDVVQATRQIAEKVKNGEIKSEDIDEEVFSSNLSTAGIPDPELLIRTSGERRISNFLLWQIAYSELYFTEVLWPDFRKEHLYKALLDFQQRERRFGGLSSESSQKTTAHS